jgi:phosphoglycolate phosphatase-like HAD superfamily hydrolase
MTEQRIKLVTLDIAGTSIDEGGAVYVALRNAVESHTGKPIPDDQFDRWKGTGKRQAIEGLLGQVTVGEIDAVESDFTDQLLHAYRSAPPVPLPGVEDAFTVLRDHDVKIVLQTGYSRAIAGPLLEQVDWRVGHT